MNCFLDLGFSSIKNNSAEIGGGVRWTTKEPASNGASVTDNKSTVYGSNFASFGREIVKLTAA